MRKALSFSIALWIIALVVPLFAHAQYYSSYPYYMPSLNYSSHTFAPYTYVNTSPYVNVNAPQYTSAYSYSNPAYSYSYPSYSYSYPSYSYPSYSYDYWYYPYNTYYSPSYMYDYWYDSYDGYCYSGYGCYPMYVADPYQWLYDPWGGYWY